MASDEIDKPDGTTSQDEGGLKVKPRKRGVDVIHAELEQAKACFQKLLKAVESDNRRVSIENARAASAERMRRELWNKECPGEPYDPSLFEEIVQSTPDKKLQDEFHAIHYAIARLTDEFEVASGARSKSNNVERARS